MKEIWKMLIRKCLAACGRCHSTGYIELPNGDTMQCPVCQGKGVI
jgi:hypothetical protein